MWIEEIHSKKDNQTKKKSGVKQLKSAPVHVLYERIENSDCTVGLMGGLAPTLVAVAYLRGEAEDSWELLMLTVPSVAGRLSLL